MPTQPISTDLDLLGRVENAAPLTAAQHDANLTAMEQHVNGIKTLLRVPFNDDGSLKDGVVQANAAVPGVLAQTYKEDVGVANAYQISFTTPFVTLASLLGIPLLIKAANTNTAACTLKVDGLAATTLEYYSGKAVAAGNIRSGQIFMAVFDGTIFQFLGSVAPQATATPAGICSFRNLLITNNSGSPNNQLDITIDEAMLRSAAGRYITVTGVSKTLDMAAAAAVNGREAGYSEPMDAWTYVWLAVTEDGATVGTFFSSSATALSVSTIVGWSGDIYACLLGAARQTGSNLVVMYQQDKSVFFNEATIFTAKTGTTTYSALSGADLTAFQTAIPPIAKRARGAIGSSKSADSGYFTVAADSNGLGAVSCVMERVGTVHNSFYTACPFTVPLKTSQNLYWKTVNTSNECRMTVSGYEL